MSDQQAFWQELIRLGDMPTSIRIGYDEYNDELCLLDAFSGPIELEGACDSDAFDGITGITQNEASIVIERMVRLPRLSTVRAYKHERKGDRGKRRGKARYVTVKTYLPRVRIEPVISDGPVMDYTITTGVRESQEDLRW